MSSNKKTTPKPVAQNSAGSKLAESKEPPMVVNPQPLSIRAEDGDNYLTIAERYGLDASELYVLNGQAPIITGVLIRLK